MANILVDGKRFGVPDGRNVLHACLSLGFDLPYFCWHPAMGSVGACRQCAVKEFRDENDNHGKIVMACMTAAKDGTRISIRDPEATDFRRSVTEWLMVNHPHDCPVCDEGGECHLQDMTVMTGHNYREFRFDKRTHRNQNLGPLVNHEMNRCIACYRCTRFYRDYAGGRDFDVFSWHDSVYFGRGEDGVLENEFSGNLVEVCPTGVFDDKTLMHHFSRKWDLQTAPSVCANCGIGCNTIPGERYGLLRRIRNRYHPDVNGYFLCDRGRYGYEFVNSDRRIREPISRKNGKTPVVEFAATSLGTGVKVIGIGSPRASLESNFALRALVGAEHFYHGVSNSQHRVAALVSDVLRNGPAHSASLKEVENADAVLVLGEDVTNTAPMLALAIRQSVQKQPRTLAEKLKIPLWDDAAVRELLQDQKGPLFITGTHATKLDEVAQRTFHAAPDDQARLGFEIAHAIDSEAPAAGEITLAHEIAAILHSAERPIIVAGTSYGNEALIQAAANVTWALRKKGRSAALSFVVPECNSLGLAMIDGKGGLEAAAEANADCVIVLENDVFRRDVPKKIDVLLKAAKHVIAIDHLASDTTEAANVVFPATTFADGTGTLVNNEGRAQRFYKVMEPPGSARESWRWLQELMIATGRAPAPLWENVDAIDAALAEAIPILQPITRIAPAAGFRIAGEVIPRQSLRYSGRTAIHANVSVHEPRPPEDPDSPLGFTMEGYPGEPPPPLIQRYWAPGWNSVQSLNKFQQEVDGPLRGGDPGQRLVEPSPDKPWKYFENPPAAFAPSEHEWLTVPIYHIFGSEELSVLSHGIAQLTPRPYLGVNPSDAARLGFAQGQQILLGGKPVAVKLLPSLPPGVVGVPAGLPGMPVIDLSEKVRLGGVA